MRKVSLSSDRSLTTRKRSSSEATGSRSPRQHHDPVEGLEGTAGAVGGDQLGAGESVGLVAVQEAPRGVPEVFEDVDEVDDDRDVDAAVVGFGGVNPLESWMTVRSALV
ncbi:hypothetical protein AB0H83_51575 [Dactylosporangium sp. NPDC050688]|uniref:hypothetical protein n=1 Tax=Dactylosporangium sp. NPDC050688 TaxID=3157217 RepID=UPI0033C3B786